MPKKLKPFISIRNLSLYYAKQAAVEDVSLDIEKGDFIGLVGPNGAGKTSLVRAIIAARHQHANSQQKGKILFKDTSHLRFGYLPQQHYQLPHFPADGGEVVLLGLLASKKNPKLITQQDKNKIDALLTSLDIAYLKNRRFSSLSGGQKQLFLLARALVAGNNFFIFDEPTTALSPTARRHFLDLIIHLNKQHQATIIFITHDIADIKDHANKILYLDRHLKFYGTTKDFIASNWSQPAHAIACHDHP